jgi:DNA-binding MarR family transcriptional regulator
MSAIEQTASFRIAMALRAHRNRMALQLASLDPPLYVGQELILGALLHEEGVTQRCLAERVGIDASTMTKALQRMERHGLLERRPDPDDTRASQVFLSAAGRALAPELATVWATLEAQTVAGFTADEVAQLNQYLERIAHNLG